MACRANETLAEPKSRYMTYLCECGKKWRHRLRRLFSRRARFGRAHAGGRSPCEEGLSMRARVIAATQPSYPHWQWPDRLAQNRRPAQGLSSYGPSRAIGFGCQLADQQ